MTSTDRYRLTAGALAAIWIAGCALLWLLIPHWLDLTGAALITWFTVGSIGTLAVILAPFIVASAAKSRY